MPRDKYAQDANDDESKLPPPPKVQVYSWDALRAKGVHLPTPLIRDFLYQDGVTQLTGSPGSCKTAWAVGAAVSIAVGYRGWMGSRVVGHGNVLYVAAEDGEAIVLSALAFCKFHGINPDKLEQRLFVITEPFPLRDPETRDYVGNMAKDLGAVLVIVDTKADVTGGWKENDNDDGKAAAEAMKTIHKLSGAGVLACHHASRASAAAGQPTPRGSTAFTAAMWSDLVITRTTVGGKPGKLVRLSVNKHKRVAEPNPVDLAVVDVVIDKGTVTGTESGTDLDRTFHTLSADEDLTGEARSKNDVAEAGDRVTVLRVLRRGGRFTTTELVDETALDQPRVFRACKALQAAGKAAVDKSGKAHKHYATGGEIDWETGEL